MISYRLLICPSKAIRNYNLLKDLIDKQPININLLNSFEISYAEDQ